MNKIKDIRLDIERWFYRIKRKHLHSKDVREQAKAIRKANKLSDKTKKRLWVLRIGAGEYGIYPKGTLKSVLRELGLMRQIDIYHTNEYIVHITKKSE